jgi:lysophospholipase L1-like esterase
MVRRIAAIAFFAIVSVVTPHEAAGAQGEPPPRSMAAIGDSITQAADVCCWYGDHPANSWSTGAAGWDGVLSHYERLRSINPAITGQNHNDAVSGARMADGPAQAQLAVAQQAEYVTILLGANDLCTSAPETMTDTETFRAQFHQTLQTLDAGLPGGSRIFVASIPDVYQLWAIYHTNPVATFVWDVANICQSLLAPERTDDQRLVVRTHNIELNTVLRDECAASARCLFDNDAVFGFQFTRAHVSRLDYFHPSLAGQAALAEITWAASWWR